MKEVIEMVEVDGVRIREVDVSTPHIYSLQWMDEYARKWEVLIERVGWNYLIRQVLVLDREDYKLYDVTLRPECIKTVRERVKGFTTGSSVLSWNDFMVEMKNKEVM